MRERVWKWRSHAPYLCHPSGKKRIHFSLVTTQITAGNMPMKITRLYTGTDNQSHFEEIEVPFESRGGFGLFTIPEPAKSIFFREIPPVWEYAWHNVVCREYVVTIDGEAEIEVGSGEKRVFRRGDVLLAEDLVGQGHRTRVVGNKVWRQVFVTLP
jgi:hypothetical protein